METREQKAPHPDSIPERVALSVQNIRSEKTVVIDLLNDADRTVVEGMSLMSDVFQRLPNYKGETLPSVRAAFRLLLKELSTLRGEVIEDRCGIQSPEITNERTAP